MTKSELERLERIAVQLMAGNHANPHPQVFSMTRERLVAETIKTAQELIKQLDALKIPE